MNKSPWEHMSDRPPILLTTCNDATCKANNTDIRNRDHGDKTQGPDLSTMRRRPLRGPSNPRSPSLPDREIPKLDEETARR